MGTYRWDKRRAKKQKRKRYVSIPVFDAVLVFLIFVLGLLLFRLLSLNALVTSYCYEQIANYGATLTTPPVFKFLYYISLTLFALWGAMLVSNMRHPASWFRFIWDATTGLSIIIMCGLYFHLCAWNDTAPPDGTLGVGEGVWTAESGTPEWRKLPPMQIPLEWTGGTIEYFTDYQYQKCVWLDSNKISVTLAFSQTAENFDDYVKHIQDGGLRDGVEVHWGDPLKLHQLIAAFFQPSSHLDRLIASQYTRSLTENERARFVQKRACMKQAYDPSIPGIKKRKDVEEKCDPLQVPYWPPGSW